MLAYKFTGVGGVGVFTGFRWPTPAGGAAGAWVEVDGAVTACERGVHACRLADLPYWIAPELWEIELDGVVADQRHKIVARRGRLVRRVPGWPELERPFALACAARAGALAVERLRAAGHGEAADRAAAAVTSEDWQPVVAAAESLDPLLGALTGFACDCVWDLERGYHTMCAYVAATAFGCASTGRPDQDMTSAGWDAERARQADWLTERLALT